MRSAEQHEDLNSNEGQQEGSQYLLNQLSSIGVRPASLKHQDFKLPCNIELLDTYFDGGLPMGGLVEWGAPLGRCGRDVALAWLAGATNAAQSGGSGFPSGYYHTRLPSSSLRSDAGEAPNRDLMPLDHFATQADTKILWVYGKPELTIYPPAWQARGLPIERMRFACSQAPLEDLRPVFLEPLFKIIVLDTPMNFSDEDCAFVVRQARQNNQLVIVIRDFFLGIRSSNVWSKIRLNCWFDSSTQKYNLRVVRGLPPRHIVFSEQELYPPPVKWQ
jgi:hypothetical protein